MVSITDIEVLFVEIISKSSLKKKYQNLILRTGIKGKKGRCGFLRAEALKYSMSVRSKYSKKRTLETQSKQIMEMNIFMKEPTTI